MLAIVLAVIALLGSETSALHQSVVDIYKERDARWFVVLADNETWVAVDRPSIVRSDTIVTAWFMTRDSEQVGIGMLRNRWRFDCQLRQIGLLASNKLRASGESMGGFVGDGRMGAIPLESVAEAMLIAACDGVKTAAGDKLFPVPVHRSIGGFAIVYDVFREEPRYVATWIAAAHPIDDAAFGETFISAMPLSRQADLRRVFKTAL